MTVISTVPDLDTHTLTLTAEFTAPPEQVWRMWSEPRLLERWWGPPMYPATVTRHELEPDGIVAYFMTGPEGETYPGWWRVLDVQEPHLVAFEDGFGEPGSESDLPSTTTRVTINDVGNGVTRMVLVGTAPSREALQQLIDMGMLEGIAGAASQIDALLEEAAALQD
jgi:uncharacterized protein YndB with AHSA1/START domain